MKKPCLKSWYDFWKKHILELWCPRLNQALHFRYSCQRSLSKKIWMAQQIGPQIIPEIHFCKKKQFFACSRKTTILKVTCRKLRCHPGSPIQNFFPQARDLARKKLQKKGFKIVTYVGWPHEEWCKSKNNPPRLTRYGSDELKKMVSKQMPKIIIGVPAQSLPPWGCSDWYGCHLYSANWKKIVKKKGKH